MMNDKLPCCRRLLKRICCCCWCCHKLCKCCNNNNNNNDGDDDLSQQEDIYMFQKYHHRLPANVNEDSSKSSGGVVSLRHVELNDSMGSTKSIIRRVYMKSLLVKIYLSL